MLTVYDHSKLQANLNVFLRIAVESQINILTRKRRSTSLVD